MEKNKNYLLNLIVGIIWFFISLWLLIQGRVLIGIFGGMTSIEILRDGLKKTNTDNR